MKEPPIPLTAISEAQRAQATERFTIIRSALEDGVTQTQVASTHNISVSTVRRWVKRYREKGLAGLADAKARSDKGRIGGRRVDLYLRCQPLLNNLTCCC
jgi:transposase